MDKRIVVGDKLDLEKIETNIFADPDKVPVVYSSQVLDVTEDGNLIVAMPMLERRIIPIEIGQEFIATFYSRTGLLRCQVNVTERGKRGTLYYIEIEQISDVEKMQRREFFRLGCNMPLEYRVISNEERRMIETGTAYHLNEQAQEWKQGVILDLSGGGIRFVSPYHEETDAFVQVRFNIELNQNREVIYLFSTVLRSEQNKNNSQNII